ncbi:unnamed protein product [Thelazia callipaeda]|uniref:Peptidase A1 domain-containing protein n=1 Tax=Thelazia callipaeda TaxID=103827 RepID=A0A0N5CW53_THECL|nr:unnamed protein product [Thelazia callipaeda]
MNAHFLLKLLILSFAYVCYAAYRHYFPLYPVYKDEVSQRQGQILKKLVGYVLKVEIGAPGKNYTLLVNTLSPISWVVGSKCSHPFCNNKTIYKKTPNGKRVGKRKYDFGSVKIVTENWQDKFSVKENNGDVIQIPQLEFGALSEFSWMNWENYEVDGIFGLANLHKEEVKNPLTESLSAISVLPTVGIMAPPPVMFYSLFSFIIFK